MSSFLCDKCGARWIKSQMITHGDGTHMMIKNNQCASCDSGMTIKLHDGRAVCSSCPDWLAECEAVTLLAMPLEARRAALIAREGKRGDESVRKLKDLMRSIHGARN